MDGGAGVVTLRQCEEWETPNFELMVEPSIDEHSHDVQTFMVKS